VDLVLNYACVFACLMLEHTFEYIYGLYIEGQLCPYVFGLGWGTVTCLGDR